MRTHQHPLQPAEYSHLMLQHHLVGAPVMTETFLRTLALRLEEFIPVYQNQKPQLVPGISAAVAILRNQRPLELTWALLKANDNRLGCFTLGLGCPLGFPIHLYVGPYPADPPFYPKKKDGRVIFGRRRGQVNAVSADFGLAMEIITGVLANGGLYGASSWEDPRVFPGGDGGQDA